LRTLSLNNIACRKECASKLKKNMYEIGRRAAGMV